LAPGQFPILHDAQEDTCDLESARNSNHFRVNGERDVSGKLFGKGLSCALNAELSGYPAGDTSDELVDPILRLEDRSGETR
jgi:hypothetical protein